MKDFLVTLNWMFVRFRNGALGHVRKWKLKDCISVHKLLGTVLADHDAASSKYLSYLSCFCLLYLPVSA